MAKSKQNSLVRLDAVMDLFGRPAGWMLYWGNAAILLLFVLLIGLSAWISYPDEVNLTVEVSTSFPPTPVVTVINGAISQVFVEEGEIVTTDQTILLLDNPAKHQDVKELDVKLSEIQNIEHATDVFGIDLAEDLDVGELGPAYAELLNYMSTLKYWLSRSREGQRAKRLNLQLAQKLKQEQHLLGQLEQLKEEVTIAERNAQQYTDLFKKGAASQLEVDQTASNLLQIQRQLESQDHSILQNNIQTESLELEKIRLSEQFSDQVTEQWLALKQQQRSLRQAINNWEDKFLIKSKADGTITFFQPLDAGQYLELGQTLGSVVTSNLDSVSFLAQGYLSSQAIGKVKLYQPVFIELNAYPYREFGQLKGQVSQLALAPGKENNGAAFGYRIIIQLPEKLLSTYGKKLLFRQQLRGNASIITEDRSLLNRIVDRFKDLRNN